MQGSLQYTCIYTPGYRQRSLNPKAPHPPTPIQLSISLIYWHQHPLWPCTPNHPPMNWGGCVNTITISIRTHSSLQPLLVRALSLEPAHQTNPWRKQQKDVRMGLVFYHHRSKCRLGVHRVKEGWCLDLDLNIISVCSHNYKLLNKVSDETD